MTEPGAEPASVFPRSIGQPATRALALAGFSSVEQLAGASARELLQLHGVGPKAIRVLREEMTQRGLSFAGE